jgi:hypothetical protein
VKRKFCSSITHCAWFENIDLDVASLLSEELKIIMIYIIRGEF